MSIVDAGPDVLSSLPDDERDAVARALAASFAGSVTTLDGGGDERRWWRVMSTDTFDAWLIDWPVDTSVHPHDHGGAAASISVVRGQLEETLLQDNGHVARTTALAPGQVHRVASDAVHDIINPGPHSATSVHVYSPPLRSMVFYDSDGVPTRLDQVEPEPALWSTSLP